MPQLSLYLDESSMSMLREASKREGTSISKCARARLARTENTWPGSFWETYGAVQDETFTVPDEMDAALDGPLPSFGN
jgi:hypothetical protein